MYQCCPVYIFKRPCHHKMTNWRCPLRDGVCNVDQIAKCKFWDCIDSAKSTRDIAKQPYLWPRWENFTYLQHKNYPQHGSFFFVNFSIFLKVWNLLGFKPSVHLVYNNTNNMPIRNHIVSHECCIVLIVIDDRGQDSFWEGQFGHISSLGMYLLSHECCVVVIVIVPIFSLMNAVVWSF